MISVRSLSHPLLSVVAVALCAACSSASVSERLPAPENDEAASADVAQPAGRSRLVRVDVDNAQGGKTDKIYAMQYNAAGLAVGERIDENADGQAEHVFAYVYGENRLLKSLFDANSDGSVDVTRRFTYTDKGVLKTLFVEPSDPAANGQRITYEADKAGRLVLSRRDANNDGYTDTVTRFRYDSLGRVVAMETDEGADEVVDAIRRFTYDAAGRMISATLDKGVDGSIEQNQRFTYESGDCQLASNHQPFQHICVVLP